MGNNESDHPTLVEALAAAGITQVELAAALGVSQPSVHRKLHGFREWNRAEINAVLALLHRHDPTLTYEQLFGDPARAVAS